MMEKEKSKKEISRINTQVRSQELPPLNIEEPLLYPVCSKYVKLACWIQPFKKRLDKGWFWATKNS